MPVVVPANAHKMAIDFLLGRSEVTLIAGTRVAPEVDKVRPCVQVSLVTGSEHFRSYFTSEVIDFKSYAETIGQARILNDTVAGVLWEMPGAYAAGAVTGVDHEAGPHYVPDDRYQTQGKAMPCLINTFRIYTHPLT